MALGFVENVTPGPHAPACCPDQLLNTQFTKHSIMQNAQCYVEFIPANAGNCS
jgi:hypothetical protein